MTNLSPHFTLECLCTSQIATRYGINNLPDSGSMVFDNLSRLCVTILEPLYAKFGMRLRISSGYRCPALNAKIGGAAKSQHVYGQAVDIEIEGLTPRQACNEIKQLALHYDQLILEFNAWCHVSIAATGVTRRGENLTASTVGGKTVYVHDIAA